MDNLKFEKIWIDDYPNESFQVKISASNERISMYSSVYMETSQIREIGEGISALLTSPFEIVLGNNDESFLDCVILSLSVNKHGWIRIKIFMKTYVDQDIDGIATNDMATFYLDTDLSSLDEFSRKIKRISFGDLGEVISLNQ